MIRMLLAIILLASVSMAKQPDKVESEKNKKA